MFERITPVNKALILVNVVVFGLQYLLGGCSIDLCFALWPPQASDGGPLFQALAVADVRLPARQASRICSSTCSLCSCSVRRSRRLFGRGAISIYYLVCVIGAALMHLIVVSTANLPPMPMVGASGGVFGLLLASAWRIRSAS